MKVPDELRLKMDRKTKKGKMIEYGKTSYHTWLEKEKKIMCSRNVEFNKHENSKDSMVTVEPVLEQSESEDHNTLYVNEMTLQEIEFSTMIMRDHIANFSSYP